MLRSLSLLCAPCAVLSRKAVLSLSCGWAHGACITCDESFMQLPRQASRLSGTCSLWFVFQWCVRKCSLVSAFFSCASGVRFFLVITHSVPRAHPLSSQPKQTAVTRRLCKVSAFAGPRSIPLRRRVSLALCTLSCACYAVIPGVSSRHDGSVNGGHRRVRSVDTAATKETLAVRKGVLAPQYVHVPSPTLSSMCLQVGS